MMIVNPVFKFILNNKRLTILIKIGLLFIISLGLMVGEVWFYIENKEDNYFEIMDVSHKATTSEIESKYLIMKKYMKTSKSQAEYEMY
jgi:hypothetical protein